MSHSLPHSEVSQLLVECRRGNGEASSRLLELVYDELRRLANGVLDRRRDGHTLQPTALVHEACARLLTRDRIECADRAHFLALCAKVMRGILADHARSIGAAKRGGAWERVTVTGILPGSRDADVVDALTLHSALEKLATLNERQARVIECRFFAGMTVDEVALSCSVSKATVEADWRMARAWLSAEISRGIPP